MPDCGGRQKFIIRTSDRGIFKGCRQRWDFASKIRGDYEPFAPQVAFDFGTSIHAGLEQYYKNFDHENRNAIALAAFLVSEQDFRKKAKVFYTDGVLPEEIAIEFDERTELGKGMMLHYFGFYQHEKLKPVKVEIEFELQIPVSDDNFHLIPEGGMLNWDAANDLMCWCTACKRHHSVYYQGRCDMLVEDQWGRYWIWDHKTAGQFGSTEWLDIDDQCGSYIWALRSLCLPIQGVVYNRLLKAVPHPPTVLASGKLSVNKQQRMSCLCERSARITFRLLATKGIFGF